MTVTLELKNVPAKQDQQSIGLLWLTKLKQQLSHVRTVFNTVEQNPEKDQLTLQLYHLVLRYQFTH